jgi:hypothetical protein
LPDGVGQSCPDDHVQETVVFWCARSGEFDGVDGGKACELHLFGNEVHENVEGRAWHDVNEEAAKMSMKVYAEEVKCAHVVVLSRLWNTRLLRHMTIATALFPNARQYVLMSSRFDCGKNQIEEINNMLTK